MAEPTPVGAGRKDDWAVLAKEYFNIAKGPTVGPTKTLLEMADARYPFSTAESILDNGCGPG